MNDDQHLLKDIIRGDHVHAQIHDARNNDTVEITDQVVATDSINPVLFEGEFEKSGYEAITVKLDDSIELLDEERRYIWIDTHTRITREDTVNAGWFQTHEAVEGVTPTERKKLGDVKLLELVND